ncbi:hypothetical protein [Vallitalea guaymasensis]|uniref:hypothetical protein n=1 Tax=Vallitalea guaymasensis TaxID=1185412 RepID=UPI00235486AC|nr:hypothetical protein [Vallitalea guaymasensis]
MKDQFNDNDVTIADMNVPGMPWYRKRKKVSSKARVSLNRRERWAAMIGFFEAIFPIIMIYAAGILLIFLFIYFIWL